MSLRNKYTEEEWQKITEEIKDFTPYELLLKEIVYGYKDEAIDIEKQAVYNESLKEMKKVLKDYGLNQSYLGGLGNKSNPFPIEGIKKQLEENLKRQVKTPEKGQKLSKGKAPIAQLFKQFPLAFEQLALRSQIGHEKYIATDADWMNWKSVPNAEFEFEQAKGRHSLKLGEEETDFEHLVAEAWNALALIQLKLENK